MRWHALDYLVRLPRHHERCNTHSDLRRCLLLLHGHLLHGHLLHGHLLHGAVLLLLGHGRLATHGLHRDLALWSAHHVRALRGLPAVPGHRLGNDVAFRDRSIGF